MTLGLKDLYYAVCTEADGAESYGTPKKMAEAMSADLSVKTADGSLYADDTPYVGELTTSMAISYIEIKGKITVTTRHSVYTFEKL